MSSRIDKILVSQPAPSNPKSPYSTLSEEYNVEFTFKPFFKIEPVTAREFRDQKINILDHTAIVLTSRTAADYFFRMVQELRLTMPDTMKYFCSSEAVATYLQKYIVYRKRKIFFAENGHTDELIKLVQKHPKEKYFIPSAEGSKERLIKAMDDKSISYTTVVLYNVVNSVFDKAEIDRHDMLVFFSPNAVTSLFQNVPDYQQGHQLVACFGDKTAKILTESGIEVTVAAPSPEFTSMPAAIESLLQKNGK